MDTSYNLMKSIFTLTLIGLWAANSIVSSDPIPIEFELPSLGVTNGWIILAVSIGLIVKGLITLVKTLLAKLISTGE